MLSRRRGGGAAGRAQLGGGNRPGAPTRVAGGGPGRSRSPGAIAFGSGSLWVANHDDGTVSRVDPQTLADAADDPGGPNRRRGSRRARTGVVWSPRTRLRPPTPCPSTPIDPAVRRARARGTARQRRAPAARQAVAARRRSASGSAPSAGLLTRLDARTGRIVQKLDPNATPGGDRGRRRRRRVDRPTTRADNVIARRSDRAADADRRSATDRAGSRSATAACGSPTRSTTRSCRIDPEHRAVTTTIPVGTLARRGRGRRRLGVGRRQRRRHRRPDRPADGQGDRDDRRSAAARRRSRSPDGRVWVTVDAQTIAPAGVNRRRRRCGSTRPSTSTTMDPALAYDHSAVSAAVRNRARKLVNYPDKPGPAGAQLTPEVAQSLPVDLGRRQDVHVHDPPGLSLLAAVERARHRADLQGHDRARAQPEDAEPAGRRTSATSSALRAYMAGKAQHISRGRGAAATR